MNDKVAILQISSPFLKEMLMLPDHVEIEDIWFDFTRNGLVLIKVSGGGHDVEEGHVIPPPHQCDVTQHISPRGEVIKQEFDWHLGGEIKVSELIRRVDECLTPKS
jgi:hypothetical protein